MEQNEIKEYVESFFSLRECKILENNEYDLVVEINEDTDKDLGYRPFYWSYVENAKIKPEPLVKRYIFDPSQAQNSISDEYLLFGSQRLRQIFMATKKRGQYIRLYEQFQPLHHTTALTPWIMLNYKIEFICDVKREELLSYGFNLITGEIQNNFYENILLLSLTPKLPNYLFTPSPIYSIQTAINHVENQIKLYLQKQDEAWAKSAWYKHDLEKEQTIQFYQENLSKYVQKNKFADQTKALKEWEDEKSKRLQELEWQYQPRIEVSPICLGILYLRHNHKE